MMLAEIYFHFILFCFLSVRKLQEINVFRLLKNTMSLEEKLGTLQFGRTAETFANTFGFLLLLLAEGRSSTHHGSLK